MKKIVFYAIFLLVLLGTLFILNYKYIIDRTKELIAKNNYNIENAIAYVNDEYLTYDEFTYLLSKDHGKYSLKQKKDILKHWVESEMLAQEAKAEGIYDDPIVKVKLKQILQEYLANELVRRELQFNRKIELSELRQYYADHKNQFMRKKDEYYVKLIAVDNKKEAKKIYNNIRKKKSTFDENIQFSIISSPNDNGDIGKITLDDLDSKVQAALKDAQIGTLTKPIYINNLYLIIKVYDIKRAGEFYEFDDVKDAIKEIIMNKLKEKIYKSLIIKLKDKYNTGIKDLDLLYQYPDSFK